MFREFSLCLSLLSLIRSLIVRGVEREQKTLPSLTEREEKGRFLQHTFFQVKTSKEGEIIDSSSTGTFSTYQSGNKQSNKERTRKGPQTNLSQLHSSKPIFEEEEMADSTDSGRVEGRLSLSLIVAAGGDRSDKECYLNRAKAKTESSYSTKVLFDRFRLRIGISGWIKRLWM